MTNLSDLTPEEYPVIQIDESILRQFAPTLLLSEGRWVAADQRGWSYRVDAENPAIKQQRHVHVSRDKHLRAKDQQVAWNQDGKRHDKKSFNTNLGGLQTAKQIARAALNLPDSVILEDITDRSSANRFLTESLANLATEPVGARVLLARFSDGPWDRLI